MLATLGDSPMGLTISIAACANKADAGRANRRPKQNKRVNMIFLLIITSSCRASVCIRVPQPTSYPRMRLFA
jgi:hypothetical protein